MRCTTTATQVGVGVEFPQRNKKEPLHILFSQRNKANLFKPSSTVLLKLPNDSGGIEGDVVVTSGREGEPLKDELSPPPRLEVRPSPGRGLGLFAITPIAAYTKVLEDDALLSLAEGEDLPDLWTKYTHLPPQEKQVFDSLYLPPHLAPREKTVTSILSQRGYTPSEARQMAQINSRWQANAFKTEARTHDPSHPWARALFGMVARINHSCTPNASAAYQLSATQVVYALRDIKAGDEIEIAYLDITMAKSDRQARSQSWGFACSCPACSGSDEFAGGAYEERITYLHQQKELKHAIGDSQDRTNSLTKALSIAHSTEYPWLVSVLPHLYLGLFNQQMRAGKPRAKAREALLKVLEWQVKTSGPGTVEFEIFAEMLKGFDAGST